MTPSRCSAGTPRCGARISASRASTRSIGAAQSPSKTNSAGLAPPVSRNRRRCGSVASHPAAGSYTLPDDQYASWTGEAASDCFGSAIGGLFDLDADGIEDFAVSAPGNDEGASAAGKVYVLPAY
ncbi:MAG: hypothetical protein EXR71_02450 [Myxococcales bacterium]|nr:hypothetical protein [Myxococcales bacterium]